jgi:hypothetical protein
MNRDTGKVGLLIERLQLRFFSSWNKKTPQGYLETWGILVSLGANFHVACKIILSTAFMAREVIPTF